MRTHAYAHQRRTIDKDGDENGGLLFNTRYWFASLWSFIGGSGFVGQRLMFTLLSHAKLYPPPLTITLLDLYPPMTWPKGSPIPSREEQLKLPKGVSFVKCDLTQTTHLMECLANHTFIFHLASYGMSGFEMLQVERIQQVNVDGTKAIIRYHDHTHVD